MHGKQNTLRQDSPSICLGANDKCVLFLRVTEEKSNFYLGWTKLPAARSSAKANEKLLNWP